MLFLKAPALLWLKIFRKIFAACICISSKSVSQTFKILFQTGDINIFVLRGVFFSRYVRLKSTFPDEKISAVKSETRFSKEPIENERGKVLKENSIIGGSWRSAQMFIMQHYPDNANENVPLTVENV